MSTGAGFSWCWEEHGHGWGPEHSSRTPDHRGINEVQADTLWRLTMGLAFCRLFPGTRLHLQPQSLSIYYPVTDYQRPNLASQSLRHSCNFCLGHIVEKKGVLGSFPGLSVFQNVVFSKCCEVPKLKHVPSQVCRTPNSPTCQMVNSVGVQGLTGSSRALP